MLAQNLIYIGHVLTFASGLHVVECQPLLGSLHLWLPLIQPCNVKYTERNTIAQ